MSNDSPGFTELFPPPYGYVSHLTGTGGVMVIDVRTRAVIPPTLATGVTAHLAMAPLRKSLFASCSPDHVTVIRPAKAPAVTGSISIGARPASLAFLRDGTRAYVITDALFIAVVDIATSTVSKIPIPTVVLGIVVTPDMTRAYVMSTMTVPTTFYEVWVIDLATEKIVKTIEVDANPNHMQITPDGRFIYLSHVALPTVTVIDTTTDAVLTTITVASGTQYAGVVAITPDGARVYTAIAGTDHVVMIDVATNKVTDRIKTSATTPLVPPTLAVTPDNRYVCAAFQETGVVSVIDTVTNAVVPPDISVATGCYWITFGPPLASDDSYNFYIAGPAADTFSIDPEPFSPRGFSTHPSGGMTPYCLAPSPDGRRLYVANRGSNDLAVIDLFTNNVLASVPTGRAPMGVAVSPDSATIYVANQGASTMSVIDAKTLKDVVTPVSVGSNPVRIAVAPDGGRVYVTSSIDNSLSVFDVAAGKVTNTLTGFDSPLGLAVAPDGKRLFVCNFGLDTVSVVDTATLALLTPIRVRSQPSGIAISSDGNWIYVTNTRDKSLSVIEAATGKVFGPIGVGDDPAGVAVSPDGRYIYVANEGSATISEIRHTPPSTWAVIATTPFAGAPGEVRTGRFWSGYPE